MVLNIEDFQKDTVRIQQKLPCLQTIVIQFTTLQTNNFAGTYSVQYIFIQNSFQCTSAAPQGISWACEVLHLILNQHKDKYVILFNINALVIWTTISRDFKLAIQVFASILAAECHCQIACVRMAASGEQACLMPVADKLTYEIYHHDDYVIICNRKLLWPLEQRHNSHRPTDQRTLATGTNFRGGRGGCIGARGIASDSVAVTLASRITLWLLLWHREWLCS